MYGVLQRRVEESGEDRQERLTYSFDKMFARERKTALGKLFEYWHAKRLVSNELPDESHFRSLDLLPEPCRIFTVSVEADEPDPFKFTVKKHPSLSAWGKHSIRRLGDLDSKMNVKSCVSEYLTCISSQQPMYHEIDQTMGSNNRHYVRLLLPVLGPSKNVTNLVYAIRIFSSTELEPPSTNS